MKIARLNRLLWVPTRTVDVPSIKADTTVVTTKPHIGKPRKVSLHEIKNFDEEQWLGVPRSWGLQQAWLEHNIVDETVFRSRGWPAISIEKYWSGQEDSINAITKSFTGGTLGALLEAPCGSGKTLMGLAVAANLNTPVLVVVHKEDLAHQWQKTAKRCFGAVDIGHIQRDKWSFMGKHLVTATAQTLYSRRHKLPKKFIDSFGLVIYDEGHRYPAETFEHVLRMMPAAHRLAVSATWRRKDGLECVWDWHVGRVEWRTASTRLVGEYAQVKWETNLYDKMFLQYGRISHTQWVTAISENDKYNAWLADELTRGAEVGRRVLCVSDRVAHLQNLQHRILGKGLGVTVGLYVGSTDKKKLTIHELEAAKQCDIILATYGMMSEGTDIPALDTLFIGTPRVDVEQVVGRIQRHKDGKRRLLVVDPVFQTRYMNALWYKRQRIYKRLDFTEHLSNEKS